MGNYFESITQASFVSYLNLKKIWKLLKESKNALYDTFKIGHSDNSMAEKETSLPSE